VVWFCLKSPHWVPYQRPWAAVRRRLESAKPLAELAGHSHWVWQARFNPQHDSLIASASSDALVNLWYLPSLTAGEPSTGPSPPLVLQHSTT
jgi:WD40 repeat protein